MDWDPTEFQKAINGFLERHGWSQNDLARASGVSQAVLNRWMQPKGSPTLIRPTDPSLRKLAPVLDIPHIELMRLAGRLAADPAKRDRDPILTALQSDLDRGWDESADEEWRARQADAIRSILGVHRGRRPNRRDARDGGKVDSTEESSFRRSTYTQLKSA